MNRFGFSDSQMNLIKQAISQIHGIESTVLFGSRAMGNYKPGSDVDIAIKGPEIHRDGASRLRAQLNEELPLPYFFDIVHYDTLESASLIEHIDQQGILI